MKTPRSWLNQILVVATAGVLGACGAERAIELPVESSKQLKSLTENERQAICQEVTQVSQEILTPERVCRFGYLKEDQKQECDVQYNKCLSEGEGENSSKFDSCSPTLWQHFEKCEITVADFESCLNEELSFWKDLLDSIACGSNRDL
jgi:hypothetical protein